LLSFKKTHAVDHAAWWPQFCELLGKDKLEYSSLVLVSALLSMADGILHPLFVKRIFDEITAKHGLAQFIVLISGYLALGMVVTLGSAGASFWAKALENRIVETVSRRFNFPLARTCLSFMESIPDFDGAHPHFSGDWRDAGRKD
jgi:ABC-type multidrug transport system fused ATPase/permease subunit